MSRARRGEPGIPARLQSNLDDQVDAAVELIALTDSQRARAAVHMSILIAQRESKLSVETFIAAYNSGEIYQGIHAKLGNVPLSTFYRWKADHKQVGPAGILPHSNRRTAITGTGSCLSDIERGFLEYWYLSPEQRSIRHCWLLLRHALSQSSATYPTARRYLDSLPAPLRDFHRLGQHKFDSLHQPYIDRDPGLYQPMEQVVSDHHNFDFVVSWDGRLFRPWITANQDYSSAKILGWCPSVYPSSTSIAISFFRTVVAFGAPDLFHCDNGKDYRGIVVNGANRRMKVLNEAGIEEEELVHVQGAIEMCGVRTMFSRPYHGQSKGRLERTFRTFAEYISKDSGFYVGSNTSTRPADAELYWKSVRGKAKRMVCLTWEEFVQALEAFIPWWNANWQHSGKGMDGRTPDEVFQSKPREPRQISREVLELAFSRAEVRTVRENGVSIDGIQYWAGELFQYSGREVLVRRPLGESDSVTVTDRAGRVICRALANVFGETRDLAQDIERVNAARKENLQSLALMGTGAALPPVGSRSFLEIASRDQVKALPIAVGENTSTRAQFAPVKSKLISPLDVGLSKEE